ncbi:hypothetical protein R3P38DRAFT_3595061 [Favolaschia claudopus]|uniref:Restriction of telomere capping protein 4 n=1 Tax=Favolaschia claudopus TaxID=2862362 RepID=A0AAW0DMX6_9AGAR
MWAERRKRLLSSNITLNRRNPNNRPMARKRRPSLLPEDVHSKSEKRLKGGGHSSLGDTNADVAMEDVAVVFADEVREEAIPNLSYPPELCPYCDTDLPMVPSETFLELLKKIAPLSTQDPRTDNPWGLKASVTVFAGICSRHELENRWLPEAIQKGWPLSIDFGALPHRVMGMQNEIGPIVANAGLARQECIYWGQAVADARGKSGGAQMANLKHHLPGYYGERGLAIIVKALNRMFDLRVVDLGPLTVTDFVYKVLVPAVAISLQQNTRHWVLVKYVQAPYVQSFRQDRR